jgi:endonuclease/exonuclease/phosphatase family metal-dependent hydrolase
MKIMSLNSAFGEQEPALREFLASKLGEVAIFCFQESTCDTMQALLEDLFPADTYDVAKADKKTPQNRFGLHTIVEKPLRIIRATATLDHSDPTVGQALATEIELEDGDHLNIVNVHGIPYGIDDKLDTKGRLEQSDRIIRWLGHSGLPAVVCGDFNLLPETQSIKKFSEGGYTNLIEKYAIPTTRNKLIWEQFPDTIQLFADYTFLSPGLRETDFTVPYTEASDHLPMIIDIAGPHT